MRTILIAFLTFFLCSSAANAGITEVTGDSVKATKVKPAKEKKAKKDKKKGSNVSEEAYDMTIPQLLTREDSMTYIFGCSQSNGFMNFVVNQLKVDTANYLNDFIRGVMDRIEADTLDKAKAAYYAGTEVATQIARVSQQFSADYYAAEPGKMISTSLLAKAIINSSLGKTDLKGEEAAKEFQQKMEARHAENKEAMYGANRLAGEKFLEENKLKEGVVTLPSGLQYKVLTEGTGEKPKRTDKVEVNYEGRLIDGTVFDSSYERNKPSSFRVNQVIKGWTEALMLMPVGSKWEVYIPQELAYGDREQGQGSKIKPYSALIFTVELLGIDQPATSTPATDAKPAGIQPNAVLPTSKRPAARRTK